MYDTRGLTYRIWRCCWSLGLRRIVTKRGGEWALEAPARGELHYSFWEDNVYKNTRRVIATGSGEVLTIALGYASILLAILISCVGALMTWNPEGVLQFIMWLLLAVLTVALLVSFPLVAFYTAFVSLRALPPKEYAQVVLAGRSAPDAIRITAYEIQSVCREFMQAAEPVREVLRICEPIIGNETPLDALCEKVHKGITERREAIEEWLTEYERGLVLREEELARVHEMKVILAQRLGIPRRKLCDHILTYSPQLQSELSRRFGANWRTLAQLQLPTVNELVTRLVNENTRILNKAQESIRRQADLLRQEELLPWVHRLASIHSTSGAALQYATALSTLAERCSAGLEAHASTTLVPWEHVKTFLEEIVFLWESQRAYPGIEPHQTCLHVLNRIIEGIEHRKKESGEKPHLVHDLDKRQRVVQLLKDILQILEMLHTKPQALPVDPPVDPAQNLLDRLRSHDAFKEDEGAFVLTLTKLKNEVERHINECRLRIAQRLDRYAAKYFSKSEAPIIVTSGYSKTIREALRGEFFKSKRPRVFVMSEDVDGDADANTMVFELTEHPRRLSVGRGSGIALVKLMSSADNVLILHGAECFDNEKRVIHAQMGTGGIDGIRRELSGESGFGGDCKIVFVAELYKWRRNILGEEPLFRFHMDRLAVYKADDIITERGPFSPEPSPKEVLPFQSQQAEEIADQP